METIVAKLAAPPLTYQFSTPANSANDTDLIFCHMFFVNSAMGNTVTWQFINEPEAKAVTFSAAPTTTPSTSPTSTTPTSSSTPTAISPSVTPPSGSGSSLSAGARAGIGVGVALAALFLVGCLVLFFASRRRKRQAASPGHVREMDRKVLAYVKGPLQPAAIPTTAPAELDGAGVRRELP
jgi:hypothetical protein